MRALAGWIRIGLCAGSLALPIRAEDGPPTLFIKVQRLIRRPGDEIQNAALIVRGGKIVAVGTDLQKPEGAREIDGAIACAGFIDPWSALGVGADSLQDPGTSAATRTVDGIDPWTNDHLRKDALRAGVTVVRVQAGANARTGGVGALLRVAPGLPLAESVVVPDCDVAMSIGLAASGGDPSEKADPFERISDLDRVVSAVESGKSYLAARTEHKYEREEWEKKIADKETELTKDAKKAKKDREKEQKDATDKGKPFQEKKYKEDKRPQPPRYDEDAEVLSRVADGAVSLLVQANRAAEIRGLLAGTNGFDRLRLVLAGGAEAMSSASRLAERQIVVLVAPVPHGRFGADEFDDPGLALAGDLSRAGVRVLLGSGGANPGASRDLPLLAQLAIGNGLDREKAFEALTLGAANAFDAGDRLGSLERGKDAEILVLDGDPLTSTAQVRYVVSSGRVVLEPQN
ncbi:MAG TPA: amidohydrolase family protein [Planctomycetota bacterium]|jgi:imidazolonepropionase-like amidohydrolase|nr:amidohydrolase family protein [Planctomycetota bacterium]